MNDIVKRVRGLISQCIETIIPVRDILDEDDLFKLGMDSLSSIKLIVAIESEFGFEFNDEDLSMENVGNIGKIAEYISSRFNNE